MVVCRFFRAEGARGNWSLVGVTHTIQIRRQDAITRGIFDPNHEAVHTDANGMNVFVPWKVIKREMCSIVSERLTVCEPNC